MMRLSRVRVLDWMPFRGEQIVEFDADQRIIGVHGFYSGDTGRNNRSGKSAFLEAVDWCLGGSCRADRETDLIHHGAERTEVEVTVVDDDAADADFTVLRWRDAKNKGGLDLLNFEGKRKGATQAQIDTLIGMTPREFGQTVFFRQNDIDQFMMAKDSDQREILSRWLRGPDWEVLETAAKEHRDGLAKEHQRLAGIIEACAGETFDKEDMLAREREIIDELAVIAKKLVALSDELLGAKMKIKDLQECRQRSEECAALRGKAAALRERRGKANAYAPRLREVEAQLAKIKPIQADRAAELRSASAKAVKEKLTATAEAGRLEAELQSMGKRLTGQCPVLKAPCDRIQPDPTARAKVTKQRDELYAAAARAEAEEERIGALLASYDAQRQLRQELELLNEKAKASDDLEDQLAEVERRRKALEAKIPANYKDLLLDASSRKIEIEGKVAVLDDRASELAEKRGALKAAWNAGLQRAERRKAAQTALQAVSTDLADAAYVAFMFGRKGIPALELENSFDRVEEEANFVLERLRAPQRLVFEATRELQEWEANCLACGTIFPRGTRDHVCSVCAAPREKKRREELSLRVLEDGQERPFYMDSGGGKVLLAVAIRLALTRLAQRASGCRWGVLFLDEVFGSLDAVNRAAMVRLITRTLVRELGFAQVFIISHEPEVRDALPDVLEVCRKRSGWSTVAWS